jgi:hypothetical protein
MKIPYFNQDDVWNVMTLWMLSIGSTIILSTVLIGIIGTLNMVIAIASDKHLKNVGDLMQLVVNESPVQIKTNK